VYDPRIEGRTLGFGVSGKLYKSNLLLFDRQTGARFRGRGFVQITGRSNYTRCGHEVSVDLAGNPDLALDPKIAAEILALYFRDHSIHNAAAAGNWELVRRRVNGGLNGWADFKKFVDGLQAAAKALSAAPAQGAYA
jgi:predicted chitinase